MCTPSHGARDLNQSGEQIIDTSVLLVGFIAQRRIPGVGAYNILWNKKKQ